MDIGAVALATLLGFIEGLTEFIPVSSTGHVLLASHFLGFQSKAGTFEVLIQLGAVLAVLSVYFAKLWQLFVTLPSSPQSRRFVAGILLAFLPAAVVGALAHDFIKTVLFESPMTICVALVVGALAHDFIKTVLFESPMTICVALLVGGVILLFIDRMALQPRYTDVMDFPLSLCLKIGLFQCLAMIPGTSRSGATIAGALLMGTDKRSAAEFSFFLAMPTMAGAFAYDLYKNRDVLSADDLSLIAVGFVVSFVTALFVVRYLLDFVSRHGFSPFAWWRIAVGGIGIVALLAAR